MVFILSLLINTNGNKRLFQAETKLKIDALAMAGMDNGSIILKKTIPCPAPSITAASSNSSGNPFIYPVTMKTVIERQKAEYNNTNTGKLSTIPNFPNVKASGMITVCMGIIIPARNKIYTKLFPLNVYFAKI